MTTNNDINIKAQSFTIKNELNHPINGEIRWKNNKTGSPLLIISHGFKAFKDWGFFPYISTIFADLDFITICFNYSLNGVSNSNDQYDSPEKFAMNTVSAELHDLHTILRNSNEILSSFQIAEKWSGEIFLLGHSLGAAISILTALESGKINKLALWAPIAKIDRYSPRQKEKWRKDEKLKFTDNRTNTDLWMDVCFLDDIENNKEKYNLPNAVSKLRMPLIIVHGKEDMTVKPRESEELAKSYDGKNLFYNIIESTGHTFGIEHPMEKTTSPLEKAIEITNYYLKK